MKAAQREANPLAEMLLAGLTGPLGEAGTQALLRQAQVLVGADNGRCPESGALQLALESQYGRSGGRGLALLSGRNSVLPLLQEYGAGSGLLEMEFRLLPSHRRLQSGLQRLAEVYGRLCGAQVGLVEGENEWLWRVERCPFCAGRHDEKPGCYFTVGLLQEFLAWLGSGRHYPVEETECMLAGAAACVFRIARRPL